jgi:hypothetical protein
VKVNGSPVKVGGGNSLSGLSTAFCQAPLPLLVGPGSVSVASAKGCVGGVQWPLIGVQLVS